MDQDALRPGTIFQWTRDGRIARILIADSDRVMYDAFWDHSGTWGLEGLTKVRRQRVAYYWTTPSVVMAGSELITAKAMSPDEVALHRPDLPTVALEIADVAWPEAPWTREQAGQILGAAEIDDYEIGLERVAVIPFGAHGGQKPAQFVGASDCNLRLADLLAGATAAQAQHAVANTSGIAIRRSGLLRGTPTYHLESLDSEE